MLFKYCFKKGKKMFYTHALELRITVPFVMFLSTIFYKIIHLLLIIKGMLSDSYPDLLMCKSFRFIKDTLSEELIIKISA